VLPDDTSTGRSLWENGRRRERCSVNEDFLVSRLQIHLVSIAYICVLLTCQSTTYTMQCLYYAQYQDRDPGGGKKREAAGSGEIRNVKRQSPIYKQGNVNNERVR